MRFALALTALIGSAAALQITSPKKDQDVDLSKKTTVEWSSVSSDPSSFDIYLVKMNSYPPVNQLVAENVKTSDGSYTIDGLSADNGYIYPLTSHPSYTDLYRSGYQVNFVSKDPQNTGILAQSQQFKVESSGSSTTSSSASTTATETSSSSSSSTGTATTTATTTASTMTTTTSGTATTTASSTASQNASSTSGTSTASTTPNGAGSLAIPAGSLLLGLAVLAL
ncbi:hypothetical protein CDV55_102331 [Aspergillus turcosus]|nr:hypothetical protein CDV55_102331 [Aspergillus turcosus]